MTDYATARHNMVESQIRPNKVRDPRLIAALSEIPRELFVPKSAREIAYLDDDLAIGGGRWLLEPMVFARLVQMAEVRSSDRVLEIGSAMGYGAAVLARLAAKVIALECDAVMARSTRQRLADLQIGNVVVVEGRLEDGYLPQAPYDVILLAGAVAVVPDRILDQLGDGGRLAGVVRPPGQPGKAMLITRVGSSFARRPMFDAASRILPGFAFEPGFVF